MKLFIVTHQFASPFSGVGTYARVLANEMIAADIEITVVCPEDQCNDMPVEFLPISTSQSVGSHARWFGLSWRFAEAVGKNPSCDIIHFIDAREAFFYRGSGPAVVGTIHDYYFTDPILYLHLRRKFPDWMKRLAYALIVHHLESRAYRRAHHLIANSKATEERILRAYGLPQHRMDTVHIALDNDSPAAPNTPNSRRRAILFVGGNPYRKGLPRLMHATARLRDLGKPAELWIVSGDLPGRLNELAGKLEITALCRKWSHLTAEELSDLYRQASCLALPGITEAYGLVFLESLANGCPIIGPADGGTVEIIDDGKNGFLVPADDDDLLLSRLSTLLDDPEIRAEQIAAAQPLLCSHTSQRMAQQTLAIYEKARIKNLDASGSVRR